MIDSHAHILNEFYDSIDDVIEKSKDSKVIGVINCATTLENSYEVISLGKKHVDFLYASIGLHPSELNENSINDLDILEELIQKEKVIAIGEIGLDYYHNKENKDYQKEIFIKQLELAKKYNLPALIHSREATDDCIKILKEHKPKGIVHCFTGSIETAREYLKLNLYIGIGGVVKFKNSHLPEVVKEIPIENIVLETDCPFLAPVPFRGKENSPKYLYYIAKRIAQIKNISVEEVIKITTNNCYKLFNLDI